MSYGGPPTGPPPFGGPPGGPPPGGPPMGPPMGHPMGHPGGYGAPPPAPGWGSPPPMMPGGGGGPPVGAPGGTAHGLGQGGGSVVQDTTGVFEGCSYKIDHRDSNSILSAQLQQGYTIKAKPGAMVAMAASVQVQGAMKFSFTKMMTGGEMSGKWAITINQERHLPDIQNPAIQVLVNSFLLPRFGGILFRSQ
ncbi:hypothetical protein FRC15_005036 [Serendipita sp. 397]|nr:hypothetical protein FRC15_005036 [Serendipita sp. 397]